MATAEMVLLVDVVVTQGMALEVATVEISFKSMATRGSNNVR